jgi:pimeloyl-ACP methyl ester carboxylesterase
MCGFFRGIWSYFTKQTPKRIDHRKEGGQVAMVLVHGFTGDTRATWAKFVDLLLADARIKTWDLFGLGYPSSLRIDVRGVWAADPGIEKLALGLITTLKLPPFSGYKGIAIAAHSMGGLVVQRAILDDPELARRISHLFFFGTPSGGLDKAELLTDLKQQIEDMKSNGSFIAKLRSDWNARFSAPPPFFFRTAAGDRDEFVPASSSIAPFPDAFRAVVPGNHLEIVKPLSAENQSFLLVVDALVGGPQGRRPAVDGARIAVELGDFRQAVDTWLPHAAELDDDALAGLALALEGVGDGAQALSVLQQNFKRAKGGTSSTDAQGILAGRLKRRWLAGRARDDFVRARELYADALQQAEAKGDHSQAYYHAINVAFLDLMVTPPNSDIPAAVAEMAERARKHCAQSSETSWRFATEAESFLMLRNLDGAETLYRRAKALTDSPREIDSMCMQAIRVAQRIFGRPGAARIEAVFGLSGAPAAP